MADTSPAIADDAPEFAFADDLGAFVDASPSPFHVVATAIDRLGDAGFLAVDERQSWPSQPGRYVLARGGSFIAWVVPEGPLDHDAAFRIAGAHTDSPNLRVKEHADLGLAGWQQVSMNPYGGPLVASWMDRDLGLSGRIVTAGPDGVSEDLLLVDEPVFRVPQLAIHFDREIVTAGLRPDPQRHLNPVWGLGERTVGAFTDWVADRLGVTASAIRGWDLMVHDVTPSRRVGRDADLLAAPRLDNQCSVHAGLRALIDIAGGADGRGDVVPVLAAFDHEEVGSGSERGAGSPFLSTTLERIALAAGRDRDGFLRMLAGSVCASSDMAHATHPNYPEKHDPTHWIRPGGGPVLKVNHNLRYATDGRGAAVFAEACAQADVPLQRYLHRADLPCGSTIGPITAGELGITTVDVGAPQLAMHSVRELMGATDPIQLSSALAAFLSPA